MSDMPELRAGPPWAMEEMILAEPGLVEPILASPAAGEIAALIAATEGPVRIVGCGTSEHAALCGAELLGVTARDAFEATLDPQEGGVLIAVSHEGGTAATLTALHVAADRGAKTAVITALPDELAAGLAVIAAPATPAPIVFATPLRDTSWCHTVGYLSPLLAFCAIAGELVTPEEVAAVIAERPRFAAAAHALAGAERFLIAASGRDEITARELALKVEEGTHVPSTPLGLEKILHGHLPAADARTGLIIIRLDPHAQSARDERARRLVAATAELGMPTVTIDGLGGHPLITGALAAQLLTLALVMERGTNPDLIRREESAYRAAAVAANT